MIYLFFNNYYISIANCDQVEKALQLQSKTIFKKYAPIDRDMNLIMLFILITIQIIIRIIFSLFIYFGLAEMQFSMHFLHFYRIL